MSGKWFHIPKGNGVNIDAMCIPHCGTLNIGDTISYIEEFYAPNCGLQEFIYNSSVKNCECHAGYIDGDKPIYVIECSCILVTDYASAQACILEQVRKVKEIINNIARYVVA